MDKQLLPQVLAVSRWKEVFETCESRRYRSLTWVAVPVSFNSTGFQRMLDDFDGVTAAALYGCWLAVLKIAATAPQRGVLAGQKGEAYTAGRLARLSGFPAELFDQLIRWCVTVGWLVDARSDVELPNLTGPDRTEPDKTGPDRTGPAATDTGPARPEVGMFLESLLERAKGKPELCAVFERQLQPLTDGLTPAEPMQCWTGCGWSDDLITMHSDPHRKAEGRQQVLAWYRRQLAAPDPIVPDSSVGAAICVLALAESAAVRPGLQKRAAWFRAQLRPKQIPAAVRELSAKQLTAAAKVVQGLWPRGH